MYFIVANWAAYLSKTSNVKLILLLYPLTDILKILISKCVDGANAIELCKEGDRLIEEQTSKVFKKEKELLKGDWAMSYGTLFFAILSNSNKNMTGIGFPTSISVNNCVCHFSPLNSDKEIFLKDGDVVKMWGF